MSVVLIAIAERRPQWVTGPSILGSVDVIELTEPEKSFYVVVAQDDTDWSDAPMDSIEWIAPRVIAFDDLLRRCVDDNVLPARFGTVFETVESLLADVSERAEPLARDLERFAEVNEFRVEISLERSSAEQSTSGLDYLKQRKNERQSIAAELDKVSDFIRERCTDLVVHERADRSVKASALAEPAAWAALLDELSAITVANVRYEGPLPPFHFVGREDAERGT